MQHVIFIVALILYVWRYFLGVTAQWLYSNMLERKFATLCYQRVQGQMISQKIVEELENTFLEFKLKNKVVKVITRNGSNFFKAFW